MAAAPPPHPPSGTSDGIAVSQTWVRRVSAFGALATLTVVAIALIQLALILVGLGPILDTLITGLVRPMQISEAAVFATTALAVRLLLFDRSRRSERARRVGMWLAFGGIAVSTLYLLSYGFLFSAELPAALRPTFAADPSDPYAGIPASNTAFALLLLNAGTVLLAHRGKRALLGQMLVTLGMVLGGLMLVVFAYGARTLDSFPFNASEMAVSASVCLLALGGGALLARWDVGVMSALVGTGPGGLVLRTSLPGIMLLPAILLGLVSGKQLFDRPRVFGQVAMVSTLVVMIGVMTLARTLDIRDRGRQIATDGETRARIALNQNAPVVSVLERRLSTIHDGIDNLEYVARCQSGEGVVAGDAHAIIRLDNRRVGLVLVDVAGHGAEPAITALRLKDAVMHSLRAGTAPRRVLEDVAWILDESGQMATAVVADLDLESGRLRCVVAGHPPPLLIHQGRATPLTATGPLLFPSVSGEWQEHDVEMDLDDTLFIYTDGLAETNTKDGAATDLSGVLASAEQLHLAPSFDKMIDWLLDPGRGQHFRDDVSLMLVRRTRPPTPAAEEPLAEHRAPAADARARYFLETR